MIKNFLSRLFSRQSREQIIEDPRFRFGEIGTKLVSWKTRENLPAARFNSDQQDQAKLARERHEQIMESRKDRKYISERIIPAEDEILGPSESSPEEK